MDDGLMPVERAGAPPVQVAGASSPSLQPPASARFVVPEGLPDNVDRGRLAPSPPTQTGRAVLRHPAFQSVARDELAQALDSGLVEESHQPRRLAPRSPGFQAVHYWAEVGLPAGFSPASVRKALRHCTDPCGKDGQPSPLPHSCPPSLHGHYPLLRYYEGSDPGRPFRHRPWFPDSRHSNFRTFHLQSSADLRQPRSTPSALAALFCWGLRRGYAGSPVPPTESSSLCSLYGESSLRTARSCPIALHPGLWPRRCYFQLLAFQCRPGQGLSPCCSSALSGAHSPALQRRVRRPKSPRPEGTLEAQSHKQPSAFSIRCLLYDMRPVQPSLRDGRNTKRLVPALKRRATVGMSLRDNNRPQTT